MSADGATAPGPGPKAGIDTLRAQGDVRVDPVGLAVIDALARRAAAQDGEARRLMNLRVEELLLARHAAETHHAGQADTLPDELGTRRVVLARLSELVDRLGRLPTSSVQSSPPHRGAASRNNPPPAPRNAVTAFKSTWSRLRAEQRLSQALAQVPAMAGPLNSSHVMNRTLQAMRDLSPEYLDAFMLHIDTLLWLEQASGVGDEASAAHCLEPTGRPRSRTPATRR
jgi:hypothetical protein